MLVEAKLYCFETRENEVRFEDGTIVLSSVVKVVELVDCISWKAHCEVWTAIIDVVEE